jgi:lipid-binding SYLF domain-containing protein
MAATSLNLDSEIYAYSKSQGLFAGVSLEGNAILIGKKSNKRFYGETSATTILASKEAPPAPAPTLVAEVTKLTTTATSAVVEEQTAKETNPATAAPPTEAKTYPMPDAEPGTEPPGT